MGCWVTHFYPPLSEIKSQDSVYLTIKNLSLAYKFGK